MGPGIRVTRNWQLVAPGLFPGLPRRSQHPIHQSTGLLFAGGTLSFQKWSKKKKKKSFFVCFNCEDSDLSSTEDHEDSSPRDLRLEIVCIILVR